MKYTHAAVAGTFDHFHAGHRYLLKEVFENADMVSIGITSQEMTIDKLLPFTIESFDQREKNLKHFLQEESWTERSAVFTLTDIYGIAVESKTLVAIYTTTETVKNAEKINEQRKEKGLPELEIVTLPLLEGDDDEPISSTRIRLGLIDREGRSYLKPFMEADMYTASVLVRDELRSPIGEVIEGPEDNVAQAAMAVGKKIRHDKPVLVITVGDIVTKALQTQKKEPDISFIDNRSRREDLENIKHSATETHGPFTNKAGTLRSNIVRIYAGIVQETIHLEDHNQFVIKGEEDLLALPAIMLAPLDSVVLYGQFEAGIVYVPVTEEIKRFCYDMLSRFVIEK